MAGKYLVSTKIKNTGNASQKLSEFRIVNDSMCGVVLPLTGTCEDEMKMAAKLILCSRKEKH